MSDKTTIEANFYDQKALVLNKENLGSENIYNNYDRLLRKPHVFYGNLVRNELVLKHSGIILDFGCGTGFKNYQFSNSAWKILGIDISEVSISFAKSIASEKNMNAQYQIMDCENMSFEDSFFDIVLDYGTFSSLDMNKALPHLIRVLKPDGTLIAIETFGHNPLTNLKRWFSMLTGRRTKWATAHIMKTEDWKIIKKEFSYSETHYFGFFVIFLGPVAKYCPEVILKIFESVDELFFKLHFLRRYAFKTIVVLRNPKKK